MISVSSNRWLLYSLPHVPVEQSISLRPVVGRQQSPGTCEHQNTPTILTTIWYHMRLVNLGASRHLRVWPPAYDIAGCVQWNSYSVVLEDTCFLVGRRTNWENCLCVCVCQVELDGVQKVCSALTIASVKHNQAKSDLVFLPHIPTVTYSHRICGKRFLGRMCCRNFTTSLYSSVEIHL